MTRYGKEIILNPTPNSADERREVEEMTLKLFQTKLSEEVGHLGSKEEQDAYRNGMRDGILDLVIDNIITKEVAMAKLLKFSSVSKTKFNKLLNERKDIREALAKLD